MNVRIKVVLATLAATAAIGAAHTVNAQDNGQKMSFADMKQHLIQRLTAELSCVQAATDEAALHACRPQGPRP